MLYALSSFKWGKHPTAFNILSLNCMFKSSVRNIVILSVILFNFIPLKLLAGNDNFNNSAGVKGGVYLNNEQAWTIEPFYSLYFYKYFGLSVGIELTGQYNQPVRTTVIDGHEAELTYNERNVAWIILKPSIILRTPVLWESIDDYMKLWFQVEPGLSLGCPFRNSLTYEIKEFQGNAGYTTEYRRFHNQGLNWFYWKADASLNLKIDRIVCGIGYSISNLDYYSGRRNVTLEDGAKFWVPKKSVSQSIFIKIGYLF